VAVRAAGPAPEDRPHLIAVAADQLATPADLIALAERLQGVCVGARLTVASAESCTGGLVGHAITEIPGSSAYYVGGVVSYADDAKRDLLGVPPDVLAAHGAVSAQVARAMATGVRERLRASLGVSVTGIAGPDGGTPDKPVGLTYVAVADDVGVDVRRFVWSGDRAANKAASARAALELLLERARTRA
jgi:nicotinamide-nucleotide amidase